MLEAGLGSRQKPCSVPLGGVLGLTYGTGGRTRSSLVVVALKWGNAGAIQLLSKGRLRGGAAMSPLEAQEGLGLGSRDFRGGREGSVPPGVSAG